MEPSSSRGNVLIFLLAMPDPAGAMSVCAPLVASGLEPGK